MDATAKVYCDSVFRTEYFSFQNEKFQDEGGQVDEDGGHLLEGEGGFHHEVIPVFIQEVGGDL